MYDIAVVPHMNELMTHWNISLCGILSEIFLPSIFVDQNYRGAEVTRSPVVISHHGENSAKRQEDFILMCCVTTVFVPLKVFSFKKFDLYYKVDVLVLCLMNLTVKIPFLKVSNRHC